MRFSEAPISDDLTGAEQPIATIIPEPERPGAAVSGSDKPDGEKAKADEGSRDHEARSRASAILRSIGAEFSRLRKQNRSGAWADLEDKVSKEGHILISTGMISAKDWVGMMIDIEQFRKAEGGTSESPGDALARWLSEGAEKPKRVKKAKTQ